MNVKEAKQAIKEGLPGECPDPVSYAKGYLKALEGEEVKWLVEALERAENLPELNLNNYSADDVYDLNHTVVSVIKTAMKALAKFKEATEDK